MTILIFFVRVYVLMAAHAMTLCLMSETKERIRYPGRAYLLSYLIFCLAFTALFSISATARSVNFLYALSLMAYLVFVLAVSSGPWLKNLFLFMAYATYFTLAVGWARYISYFFPSHPQFFAVQSLPHIYQTIPETRQPRFRRVRGRGIGHQHSEFLYQHSVQTRRVSGTIPQFVVKPEFGTFFAYLLHERAFACSGTAFY